ncbi:MAG: 5'-methylthioadenosine/adenosylhomocysteine nucleosidase [Alphaproteobacteria bacterium]|jgi:adenosylhomocysteine nucleosidase|nr:5'-methylthioadenosine/adenosylhomocysteine nucleosidase [Alphaproteobacteria bacterium]MDP6588295.1 5'-methylthioadenosine/adenosylhomocysteine nucleosidase [Alphaproteobacteria bacterium]|tara:strand:+ start:102 stop:827 length:726 start_codon:yes stop_codon:yes gene_type:complete
MLAILGAMEEEVALLRSEMGAGSEAVHAGITVIRGDFRGTEIALAQCGIGKVNAAICTQMLVNLYRPDGLIFSGVAGGLLPNMRVGDLIAASHLIQFDIDLTAFGRRHGELPDRDRMIQSDATMVSQVADAFDEVYDGADEAPNLMIGTVVSGDRFIEDTETLRWLQREFGALATEMEGAAVGYTCQINDLPFVVIRTLSDTADESAPDDYRTNLTTVCRHSFRLMEELIPQVGNNLKAAA